MGQTCLVVAALGGIAVVLAQRGAGGHVALAGVALGFAIGLKPHVGLAFGAALLIDRRWRACMIALIALLALTIVALRSEVLSLAWFHNWRAVLALAFGPGGSDDPRALNPARAGLIDLRLPLSAFMTDALAMQIVALGVGAILLAPLAFRAFGCIGHRARPLESLSLLVLVQLIAVYHHNYDAVLVLFPIAWALKEWRARWPMLVLAAVFVLPAGPPLQYIAAVRGLHPSGPLVETLTGYLAWAILAMAALMAWSFKSG